MLISSCLIINSKKDFSQKNLQLLSPLIFYFKLLKVYQKAYIDSGEISLSSLDNFRDYIPNILWVLRDCNYATSESIEDYFAKVLNSVRAMMKIIFILNRKPKWIMAHWKFEK